jgi:HSP20 family protein
MNDARSVAADRSSAPAAYLALDIRQTDGEFLLEASVPGFRPEEIEVVSEHGVLTIRGEHKSEPESKGEYLRRERWQRALFRQVSLPQEVLESEITAAFQNGVLTVRIPRAEVPARRRIQVTVESASPALEAVVVPPEKVEAGSPS